MLCPHCQTKAARFGKTRDGQQRFRCRECRKTFSDPKPLAGKSTSMDDAVRVLRMLLEGVSVRATARLTGIDRDTILRLMVQAGEQCQQFLLQSVQAHPFADVQIDEQWGFVFCKEKTAQRNGYGPDVGDCYAYIALDRDTKFVIGFRTGKRSSEDTHEFMKQLVPCLGGRPQITTDGYAPYRWLVPFTTGRNCDYAQLVKKYGNTPEDARRYSPAAIIGIDRNPVCGNPDESRISTSHVERLNLSNRMCNRRMTRLTNGHSKKWQNHEAMLALWFCWYNWCRKHTTLKQTPAVAAGLAKDEWSLEKLLRKSARAYQAVSAI